MSWVDFQAFLLFHVVLKSISVRRHVKKGHYPHFSFSFRESVHQDESLVTFFNNFGNIFNFLEPVRKSHTEEYCVIYYLSAVY